ncbi:hypothetical protein ACG0Z6_06620 [Roseateles sp. BYS180W]|uniref:Transmembrane protein n=1 Tax=Roseateles rivi TaxID=3299028 RepID=A0ABW7FUD4_9BURK
MRRFMTPSAANPARTRARQKSQPHLWREREFVRDTHQRLQREHWLRLHVALIALLTLGGLMTCAALLRLLGVESLGLRYAIALPISYLLYLGLLRLWAGYLLRRESDALSHGVDVLDVLSSLPTPRSGADSAAGCSMPMRSGGGGDFAGGGASDSFEVGDVLDAGSSLGEAAGEIAGQTTKLGAAVLDADEGAVVAIPLLVVLAIGTLLMSLLGLGVFALFGVDVLMAVVLELGLAGLAGGFAWRRQREGWLRRALTRTWKPALAMLVLGVALGLMLDHWVPEAHSLPHALRLMQHR